MRPRGALADEQELGDVLVGTAFCEMPQDLPFAVGQAARLGAGRPHVMEEPTGDRRVEDDFVAHRCPQRRTDLGRPRVLQEISCGTSLESGVNPLGPVEACQHDHSYSREPTDDLPRRG